MNKKLTALATKLAKGLKTEADLNQFSCMFTKLIVEAALSTGFTGHLGDGKNQPKKGSNARNGYSTKTLLSDDSEVELETPRDIVVNVRQDGSVITKSVFLTLNINTEDHKQLLGMWIA